MTVPETTPNRRASWPADYYSTATPETVLPRGVTYGCGIASVVALLFIFAGGAFLASGGMTDFMDFAIGMSLGDMRGAYTAEVDENRKKTVDAEIEKMREHLRAGRIQVGAIQPFLQGLTRTTGDRKVTAAEAAELEAIARKINASAK